MPAIDVLAQELRAPVFRLLDHGMVGAAADLVMSYSIEADAALWRDVLQHNDIDTQSMDVIIQGEVID